MASCSQIYKYFYTDRKKPNTHTYTHAHTAGEKLKADRHEEGGLKTISVKGEQQESVAGERQSAGVPIESLIGARSSLAAKSVKSKHTYKKYDEMGGSSPFE